ncbi:adenosylcobinamide-GDP ribazoletransferase [Dyella psychrodurans]|uniref:Adenosylcobinamide-GDP ribazoletransferase n=1 Tax=Dyella psychrodurans TaxID=1927960 RepID=A0A370X9Z1_9GAMM|nr:adenosylcobinamide-GDP ribazoletransferase [Dyella psychrodurans]RDS85253.1 adenosylcobinamide-GDP ribazoletransferase [Dyella psychrodurans]
MMRSLLVAIGFLTRLPVPAGVFDDERAQANSLAWYPLVGLLLGMLLAVLGWLLRDSPSLLSSVLVVLAWVVLTGALHLDGLADSADAWVGGLGDREKTLAIMKDPRSGPAGVVALVLVVLLKVTAITSLGTFQWLALLLAPLLARASLIALFLTTPYVRSRGLGAALTNASGRACAVSLAITAGLCALAKWRGALALLVAVLVFGLWRHACQRRLGGFTGDTAGALAEMVETAVLVVLALG